MNWSNIYGYVEAWGNTLIAVHCKKIGINVYDSLQSWGIFFKVLYMLTWE